MSRLEEGRAISWRARPYDDGHQGVIRAYVPAHADVYAIAPWLDDVKRPLRDFNRTSEFARYLVEVPRRSVRDGDALPSKFYTPRASTLEIQNAHAAPAL